MTHNVRFRSKRTQCPKCGSSDGFAGILSIDGATCGDPHQHGKCHGCGAMIWPDDVPTSANDHQPKAEQPRPASVRAGLMDETDSQTSNLHRALISIGGDGMAAHLRQWRIGTDAEGRTVFHYIDAKGAHRTSKGMAYDAEGKRCHGVNARFGVQSRAGYVDLSSKAGHRPCLFGEHWMQRGQSMIDYRDHARPRAQAFADDTAIALVESEKTAVAASFVMPNVIWIATGGSQGITKDKAEALRGRTVLMMFDCDDAGRNAAANSAPILMNAGARPIQSIDGVPIQDHVFGADAADKYDMADHVMAMLTRHGAAQMRSVLHISQGVA